MANRLLLAMLAALSLAGCQDGAPGPTTPDVDDVPEVPLTLTVPLDLQVGPPGDDLVPGIVFGYDDCGFIRPRADGDTTHILAANITLEWDDADGLEMNLTLRAEGGAVMIHQPTGPSPLFLQAEDLEVEWNSAVALIVETTLPPGELQRPARLTIELAYEGHEPLIHSTNC